MRRAKLATAELYKLACKQPRVLKVKKVKNIERNLLGEKRGRLHMGRQDINKINLKPYKVFNILILQRLANNKARAHEVQAKKKEDAEKGRKDSTMTKKVARAKTSKNNKNDIDLDL